jgi:hypothetical protein
VLKRAFRRGAKFGLSFLTEQTNTDRFASALVNPMLGSSFTSRAGGRRRPSRATRARDEHGETGARSMRARVTLAKPSNKVRVALIEMPRRAHWT